MSTRVRAEQDRTDLDLLLRGFQISRMLRLVADLGVADKVPAHGAVSMSELANACSALPDPLIRVLRALAAFDVFTVSADQTVAHTPRSQLLRTDTENSMHHSAQFWTGPGSWQAWARLDVAMNGGTPHEAAWNVSRFAYLSEHSDEARAFDAMMANFPDNRHAAIAAGYDFSRLQLIADIGGGNGAALRHILARFPAAHGLVFDREDVIAALTPDDLMQGQITAMGGSWTGISQPVPIVTSSSACCTIGVTRIACVSCALAAPQWARTAHCCWVKNSWSLIRRAVKPPPISSTLI